MNKRSTQHNPRFFATPLKLRQWFEKHAHCKEELHIGYYKVHTGKPSITWPESVDEALCFGWIDGIRHRIDEQAYRIRFTPRRERSHWSAVNLSRVTILIKEGLMRPAGLTAYEKRSEKNSRQASYERVEPPEFSEWQLQQLQRSKKVWQAFEQLPPGYRKRVTHWIATAKRRETQIKRLDSLIQTLKSGGRLF